MSSNSEAMPIHTGRWAISIRHDQADSLANLYGIAGLEILTSSSLVWVRGSIRAAAPSTISNATGRIDGDSNREPNSLEHLLRGILGASRFDVLDDGQLVPAGNQVPIGRLPSGDWQPLEDWIQPVLPPTVYVAQIKAKQFETQTTTPTEPTIDHRPSIRLKIERAATSGWQRQCTGEPELLVCAPKPWSEFVQSAAKVRLDSLGFVFAANQPAESSVIVLGKPLPPIAGTRMILNHNIATPIGYGWSPNLSEQTVGQILNIQPNEIVLFQTDGTWTRIDASSFVQASRPSVRATFGLSDFPPTAS